MSTRAYICMETKDGQYRGVYNHFDGYLSGIGEVLLNYYQDFKKVEKLINLGDLSIVGQNLEAPEVVKKYGFDWFMNPAFIALSDTEKNVLKNGEEKGTIAYCRDRGEDKYVAEWSSVEDIYTNFSEGMIVFVYLFKNGKWYYYERTNRKPKFKLLTNTDIKKEMMND
jgi:hypothetical protein